MADSFNVALGLQWLISVVGGSKKKALPAVALLCPGHPVGTTWGQIFLRPIRVAYMHVLAAEWWRPDGTVEFLRHEGEVRHRVACDPDVVVLSVRLFVLG